MKILIVDDEEHIRKTFQMILAEWGHQVFDAPDAMSALKILENIACQVVITDLKMPGVSGEELVRLIREQFPSTEVVVITGYASVESAVCVMKYGARDFLIKPLNLEHVHIVLSKIEEHLSLTKENQSLREQVSTLNTIVSERYGLDGIIGKSKAMQNVFRMITSVAPLDSTVLISGETGTGKELVARTIHYNSRRKLRPIITVDCGVLSETLLESELFGHEKGAFTGAYKGRMGLFEQADGGTIFLDEVANASPAVQKKLLRVIQEKTFERLGGETTRKTNVRIIAATNQDLSQRVKDGTLRTDLYYRLNVIPIYLPPLREREEDIPTLVRYFLDKFTHQMGREPLQISPESMEQFISYPWPGNIREVINIMERIAIVTVGNMVKKAPLDKNLSPEVTFSPLAGLEAPLKEQIKDIERPYLVEALKLYRGSIKDVSKKTGLSPRTIYRKMKHYGLDKRNFKK